ncbi:MAG: glycosyltransferase WbuB, partial [Pseudomonadota bacterium]
VINNWCDRQIAPIPKDENTLRDKWHLQDDFVIGYSGNLGRAHVPESVYRLVQELAGIPKLKMLFIGAGHGMTWLQQQCRAEGFDHVVFQPYQSRRDLSLSLSAPDIHLISLRSGCQKFIAPSKFYGILAAGRPVAFIGDLDSDMAKDIYRSRFGLTLSPNRIGDWRQSIVNVMQNDDELATMSRNARQAFDWRFAPSTSLEAWQRVLEKTTAQPEFPHEKTVVTATQ